MDLDVFSECDTLILQELRNLFTMVTADGYDQHFLLVILLLPLLLGFVFVFHLVLLLNTPVAIERLLPEPQNLGVVEFFGDA